MVLLLTKDEVASLLNNTRTIDAVEKGFGKIGDSEVPSRIQIKKNDPLGEIFVMPGLMDTGGSDSELGLKTVTIFPENDQRGMPQTLGVIQLLDPDTGRLRVVMDGAEITNYRTGAIGAVGARYLAPDGASEIGVFGSSTVGRHQAIMLDTELDIDRVRIYSRSDAKHDAVSDLRSVLSAEVIAANSPRDTCEDADVVVTATTAKEPVFPADAIGEDTLVIGVGSNDAEMREIPGEIMCRANRVVVDDYEHCLRVGDINDAIDEGALTTDSIIRFTELVRNKKRHHRDTHGIWVVKSVGSIVLDLAVSRSILQRAEETSTGSRIDLQGTGTRI